MSSKTLLMGIANTGFLIDRLGTDCGPLQYIRELTQNSIEAIQRSKQPDGEIVWDVDWLLYDLTGSLKLSITDNGIGMTGDDMVKYINHLSSSSGIQSEVANYGVGAKIAAATRNPEGLIYQSWRYGVGAMVHLWKNPEGEYGLRQYEFGDDTTSYTSEIPDDLKPELIGEHGTKVVLLGSSPQENTSLPPLADMPSPSMWLTRHLNTRYFRLPDNIALRVRENVRLDLNPIERGKLRKITGMQDYLISNSTDSGQVQLNGAIAHWWILNPDAGAFDNIRHVANGHTAALYQNELYEMQASGKSSIAALQQFGVTFGYNRVIIYVEPTDFDNLTTNTARSDLLLKEGRLPWPDWQAEFRRKMPRALQDHVIKSSPQADPQRIATKISKRLAEMASLLEPSAYRPIKASAAAQSDDKNMGSEISAGVPKESNSQGEGRTDRGARHSNASGVVDAGSAYALFAKGKEHVGRPVRKTVIPDLKWVTVKDGTRQRGDMEDRAAKYIADQNLLLVNADFRVLTDLIDFYQKQYRNDPSRYQAIVETVHEWYQQQLMEAIVSAQGLSNSPAWSEQDTAKMLSEEALTLAVMPRYLLVKRLSGSLGVKFGAGNDDAQPEVPAGKTSAASPDVTPPALG